MLEICKACKGTGIQRIYCGEQSNVVNLFRESFAVRLQRRRISLDKEGQKKTVGFEGSGICRFCGGLGRLEVTTTIEILTDNWAGEFKELTKKVQEFSNEIAERDFTIAVLRRIIKGLSKDLKNEREKP